MHFEILCEIIFPTIRKVFLSLIHFLMQNRPYFSVCTEVTNRAETIIRTIISIEEQIFLNFEFIIVDNNSNDRSFEIIESYISNSKIKSKIRLIKNQERLDDIKSWNEPLKYASGEYIVVCEGDDWFEPNHLADAYSILSKFNNIGIYVSLNKRSKISPYTYNGLVESRVSLNELMTFNFIPPPSEAIFKRNYNGKAYAYDSDNYVYAGEISLYYKILKNGYDVYVNDKSFTINRGISKTKKILGYFNIQDMYFSLEKWSNDYLSKEKIKNVRIQLFKIVIKKFLIQQIRNFKIEKRLLFHIYEEMKIIGIISSFSIILDIFFKSLFTFPINKLKQLF